MATAGGGLIARALTGSTYVFDATGAVTGQMWSISDFSWSKAAYEPTGGMAQVERTLPELGAGYAAIWGGNPSHTGPSVGVVEQGQPIPSYGLLDRGGACQLDVVGGDKRDLTDQDRQYYETQRQALVTSDECQSSECQAFLSEPKWDAYFSLTDSRASQLRVAVDRQAPFDGRRSTLSQFAAGHQDRSELTSPLANQIRSIREKASVCSLFIPRILPRLGPVVALGLTTAASQGVISSRGGVPVKDVYINTDASVFPRFGPATLLHEVLHNLTGRGDAALLSLVGSPATVSSGQNAITQRLREVGCAP